uniref:Uncharacterized protein n=1 Tax=Anopheles funestus TaxID=62324 RepID=A0A182S121_ANOFN
MHLAMLTSLCLVLIISAVSTNVIPNDASETTQSLKTVENTQSVNVVPKDVSQISQSSKTVENGRRISSFVPKSESEKIHFKNTDEILLGNRCQLDGFKGVCTIMDECPEYLNERESKAENDLCQDERQNMVICCSISSSEGSSTDATEIE